MPDLKAARVAAVVLTPGLWLWPLSDAMAGNAVRLASSGPPTLDVAGK